MKLPFTLRDRGVQANFDKLASHLGFENARCGTGTITFTASTDSASTTITHGLGATPKAVVLTAKDAPGFGQLVKLNAHTWTATSFGVNGRIDAVSSITVSFSWVAFA